jgi:hypothetical protein
VIPEEVVKVRVKHVPHVHPDAAVLEQEGQTDQVGGVLRGVGPVHGPVIEAVWEPFLVDVSVHIIRGVVDQVDESDGPGWAELAHPVDNSATIAGVHGLEALIPEGPNILLSIDGTESAELAKYFLVGS